MTRTTPAKATAAKTSRYIAVEGVIGVGKTTLAKRIGKSLAASVVLEVVEENPFLPRFYEDPESFSFQTQMFFLLSRYKQQLELSQRDLFEESIVADYIFAKDQIFATLNLGEAELALVNRGRAGDRAAFEQLVRLTARGLFARIYVQTGDSHLAEDLVQETFLRAWRRISSLSDPKLFRGWLNSIAKGVVVDSARSAARKKRGWWASRQVREEQAIQKLIEPSPCAGAAVQQVSSSASPAGGAVATEPPSGEVSPPGPTAVLPT